MTGVSLNNGGPRGRAILRFLLAASWLLTCEETPPTQSGSDPPPDKDRKEITSGVGFDAGPPTESWIDLGGSSLGISNLDVLVPNSVSRGAGEAKQACLEAGAEGRIYVAWSTEKPLTDDKSYLYARFVKDGRLEPLGSAAEGGGLGYAARFGPGILSMAIGPAGSPSVLWEDASVGGRDIYLKRWDGSKWATFGTDRANGRLNRDFTAHDPDFALDSKGHPVVVAEREGKTKSTVSIIRWNGSAWEEPLGATPAASVTAAQGASRPAVAVDEKDQVFVAWVQEVASGHAIYLRYWDGMDWREMGGSATESGVAAVSSGVRALDLALDAQGRPWIAYAQPPFLYVRRWAGDGWVQATPGGSDVEIDGRMASDRPTIRLRFAPDGAPWILWNRSGYRMTTWHVRRWDGSDWMDIGPNEGEVGRGVSGSDRRGECLSFSGGSEPLVSWLEGGEVYVKTRRSSSAAWSWIVGPPLKGGFEIDGASASSVELAVDGRARPVVAWTAYSQEQVQVHLWDGIAWAPLGKGPVQERAASVKSTRMIGPISLDVREDGTPLVAWTEIVVEYEAYERREIQSLQAAKWEGSDWVPLLLSPPTAALNRIGHDVGSPVLRAGKDGAAYLAWLDLDGDTQAYLLKWDGLAWKELDGSASAGGVSGDDDDVGSIAGLGVLPDGNPVVGWTVAGVLRVWAWDGRAWKSLGDPLSEGGPFGRSVDRPHLLVGEDGTPVVLGMVEDYGYKKHILARRWKSGSWEVLEPLPEDAAGSASAEVIIPASVGLGDLGRPDRLKRPEGFEAAWVEGAGPLIVWQETSARFAEIHAALRKDRAWQDLGGSALEGGISHSVKESRQPVVVVKGRTLYVAWIDSTLSKAHVLLRKFVLP